MDNSKIDDVVNNLPDLPGVYLMKNKEGSIIYVGKAKSLRTRVKSYFLSSRDKRPLLEFLLPKIKDIEFVVSKNEKEALILENTLIKKHRPKYNINLKDDKSYISLKLTVKDTFPRMFLTRKIKKDGSLYFGPYTSASSARDSVEIIRNIFKLRTCPDATLNNRSRVCLNYQIKKCSGPCVGLISSEEYKNSVSGVKMFLSGNVSGLIKELKSRMKEASLKENFEAAALLRDRINAINLTVEKQSAVTHKNSLNSDIIGMYEENGNLSFNVINVRGGTVIGLKNHIFLENRLEGDEALSSFLKQFYDGDKEIPKEIVISSNIDDLTLIEEWLSEKSGAATEIKLATRGEKKRVMEMALENAKLSLENKLKLHDDTGKKLDLIKDKLNLRNVPKIVECYDISNIMGKEAVGSKVVLKDGALDKANYRKYKIKTKNEPDDYTMMREVLERRFGRQDYKPDLIVIDGGKGHLATAMRVLAELNITDVDVVSLAKEKKLNSEEKEERIYIPGRKNPIQISGQPAFNMLINLRDEAHRFAITYHKKLRAKRATSSMFDSIKGIGVKKRELILSNITDLSDLTEEKLSCIEGITKSDIKNIVEFLKKGV